MLEIIIPLKIIILSYILYFRTFPWKYLNNHICPEYMTSYIKKSSYNSVPLPHHPCVWWLGQCFIHLMQYSVFAILKPVHHIEKYETCFRLRTVFCPRMLYFRIYIINSELRSFLALLIRGFRLATLDSYPAILSGLWTVMRRLSLGSLFTIPIISEDVILGSSLVVSTIFLFPRSVSPWTSASCATCYIFFAKESFNHTSHGMRLGT